MWMADRGNEVGQVQAADDVDQEQGPSSFKKSDDSHTLSWSIIGGIASDFVSSAAGRAHFSSKSPCTVVVAVGVTAGKFEFVKVFLAKLCILGRF